MNNKRKYDVDDLAAEFNKKLKLSDPVADELEWRMAGMHLYIQQLEEKRLRLMEQINVLNTRLVDEETYWSIVIN
jgi:hypothetical protein